MIKRWIVSFLLFFAAVGIANAETEAVQGDNQTEPTLFISIPEYLNNLERPPVVFNHDKHTDTLEQESCDRCHPTDEAGKIVFSFPRDGIADNNTESFMKGFHDECIECHTERLEQKQKAGPVTCGGCHVVRPEFQKTEYLPILPEYYESLRDTYHKDCLACHKDPEKKVEDAGELDWKWFYVKQKVKSEEDLPKITFDYYLHDKHEKALEKKCENCHWLSPERQEELNAQAKEPTCKDWLSSTPEEYNFSEKQSAHHRCINCHLEKKKEQKDAGPVNCRECHLGKVWGTDEQRKKATGPSCEQEDKILIQVESNARIEAVAFNHEQHQENVDSCQACHHKTLNACVTCHSIEGKQDGNYITLAEAYHDSSSGYACIGCHEVEKRKNDCSGCHSLLKKGLEQAKCLTCHVGSVDRLLTSKEIQYPADNFPKSIVKKKMEIDVLGNEYKAAQFPHHKIIKKLIDISNNSNLARYFHKDITTICSGCHHYSPFEEGKEVPLCRTCHTKRRIPVDGRPTLLGAYHQQCLGCHKDMDWAADDMPQTCTGCHEENPEGKRAAGQDEKSAE